MKLISKIDTVTLFSRGAEISRRVAIDLKEGRHCLELRDLPAKLLENSLRVEGQVDGLLEIGAVDSRIVHTSTKEKVLEESERLSLEKRIEELDDEKRDLEGRLQVAATQKNLMDSLAAMPGSPRSPKTDWGKIFDLIGERLPKVYETINSLKTELRSIEKKIVDLRQQLSDQPQKTIMQTEIKISTRARNAVRGYLVIHYQIAEAGWRPLYEARLDTGGEEGGASIDLVRRAAIHQNSGEAWEDVAMVLSTTRPSAGTSAPGLASQVLDILPEHPLVPAGVEPVTRDYSLQSLAPQEAARPAAMSNDNTGMPAPASLKAMRKVVEQEIPVEQARFQASYKVAGRVTLSGKGQQKKVRLGAQKLSARLQVRSTPMIDTTAFLHADFELEGELALLPGEVALYRDNVYVGNGHLPLLNVEDRHELGFGVDDGVVVKWVEKTRRKGSQGLIRSENTDEFEFMISVRNTHRQTMPVRILGRVPVSAHEKLKVERLKDMSVPTSENVDDERGVLAYEYDMAPGSEKIITLHYRIHWPRGEQIG